MEVWSNGDRMNPIGYRLADASRPRGPYVSGTLDWNNGRGLISVLMPPGRWVQLDAGLWWWSSDCWAMLRSGMAAGASRWVLSSVPSWRCLHLGPQNDAQAGHPARHHSRGECASWQQCRTSDMSQRCVTNCPTHEGHEML